VTRRRPLGAAALAIFVAIISAVHLMQAFTGALGDPRALVIEHVIVAALGLLAAWSIWMRRRWAPWALALAGVTVAALIVSLGPLLRMDAQERAGLWTGAGTVVVMTLAGVWYVRRHVSSPSPGT
jgi:peptidoglycan/LPS O-acetylase OafA/YrhL